MTPSDINLIAIIGMGLIGFAIAWLIFKKQGHRGLMGGSMPHYWKTRTELNALRFIPQSILAIDENNKIVYANKKAEETFGYTQQDFKDKEEKIDLILTKDCLKPFEQYKRRDHFSEAIDLEVDCITKEKKIIPVKITMGRWHDDSDDKEYLYAVIIRNILHQKINRENAAQQRAAVDAISRMCIKGEAILKTGTLHWDLDSDIIDYTPGCARIFNIPAGQKLTGAEMMSYVYPADHALVKEAVLETQKSAKPYIFEFRVGQKNGTKNLVRNIGYPVLNENGVRVAVDVGIIVIAENVA